MNQRHNDEERLRAMFAAVDEVAPVPPSGLVETVHRRHHGRRLRQVLGTVMAIALVGGVTGGVAREVTARSQPVTIQPATLPPRPPAAAVTSMPTGANPATVSAPPTAPSKPPSALASCEAAHRLSAPSEKQVTPFRSGTFRTCTSPPAPGAQADGFSQISYVTHATKDDEASNQSEYDMVTGPCAVFGLSYHYSDMGAADNEPVRYVQVGARAGLSTAVTYNDDGAVPLPGPRQITVFHNASYTLTNAACDESHGALDVEAVTAGVRSALVAAYVRAEHAKPSDISGTAGSTYYAYDPTLDTYYARAGFRISSTAPQRLVIAQQDAGVAHYFKKVGSGRWTLYDVCSTPAFITFSGPLPAGGHC